MAGEGLTRREWLGGAAALALPGVTLPGTQPVIIKYHPDNRDTGASGKEQAADGDITGGNGK